MHEGVRPDGTHLYPVFPYTSFTNLTATDLRALYAYLRGLTPVNAPPTPDALRFPYDERSLLAIWNKLFFKEGTYQPRVDRSAAWNRGAYLVQGLGHCGACHTPRNFLGAEQADLALSGAVYSDTVDGSAYRGWAAVNLTPAKAGLGAWTVEDIVAYLGTGINSRATTFGPMNDVVMNSTRYLTKGDLAAIAEYLKDLPARERDSGEPSSSDTLASGRLVYDTQCGTCHLPTGLGAPGLGVPLTGSAVVLAPNPASLINVIMYGSQIPPPPFVSGRKHMLPLGDQLSDSDIAEVASYVRASWGNAAGQVTVEQVTRQR